MFLLQVWFKNRRAKCRQQQHQQQQKNQKSTTSSSSSNTSGGSSASAKKKSPPTTPTSATAAPHSVGSEPPRSTSPFQQNHIQTKTSPEPSTGSPQEALPSASIVPFQMGQAVPNGSMNPTTNSHTTTPGNNIWSPASVSPGASSDTGSHGGSTMAPPSGASNIHGSCMSSVLPSHGVPSHSPYGMPSHTQVPQVSTGNGYSQSAYPPQSYFGSMEASYLPPMNFSGHSAAAMSSQAHTNFSAAHHHSAHTAHANQFMSQNPYSYHNGAESSLNSYTGSAECVDYKDSQTPAWRFHVL